MQEYFLFDPLDDYLQPRLQGVRRAAGRYRPIRPVKGRLPSKVLGLHLEADDDLLRLYDPTAKQWLLTPPEVHAACRKAQQETKEIIADTERLRRESEQLRLQTEEIRRRTKELRRQKEELLRQSGKLRSQTNELRRKLPPLPDDPAGFRLASAALADHNGRREAIPPRNRIIPEKVPDAPRPGYERWKEDAP